MPTDHPAQIGPYEILGELGRGAMGVVFRARQKGLDREVALKVLPLGADVEAAERFRREARLSARLRHPHIVGVHDVGEADGRLYLAMDLIRGQPLSAWLDEDSPGPRRSAELVRAIADAVAHAHQQGILHRDIKPGNILVDTEGRPFLADFGLARAVGGDEGSKLSRTGNILGTPAYMSPEQAQGKPLDGRSDIWALGAVLYELLTTQPPFGGDSAVHVLAEVVHREPVPLRRRAPGTPRDLESIAHRCLEKDPARRYADAADLVADLDHFLEGRPVHARPLTAWRTAAAWLRRNRALAATATLGALAVAGVLAYVSVILPAWRTAARRQQLAAIGAAAADRARAEMTTLAAALDACAGTDGRTTDPARVTALGREASPEAVAARIKAALPPDLVPPAGDREAAAAFDAGFAAYTGAPLQARAAALCGDVAVAYRLDPTGAVGLRAAVELARRLADERRYDEAAALLQRLRSRHYGTAAARYAAARLAEVYLALGRWDDALAAAAEHGEPSPIPADTRAVLEAFGRVRQTVALTVPPGDRPYFWPNAGEVEPLRLLDAGPAGRLLCCPQRHGMPTFRIGPDGTLAPAPSPAAALPAGTWVVDVAGGDVDGDGTPDCLAAIVRPGTGSGLAVLRPEPDGTWRLLAEDATSGYPAVGLIAGDARGDGRTQAVVLFHWQSATQRLFHWDAAAGGLVGRDWAPRGTNGWVRGGAIGDLDGDGVPEVVLGTTLHTTALTTVYHWHDREPLEPLGDVLIGEPGHALLIPDPERPAGRLLALVSEVGINDRARGEANFEGLPEDDGLALVRWDGHGAQVVARHDLSHGDTGETFPGAPTAGRVDGTPCLLFWAARTRVEHGKRFAEGRRLYLARGDPRGAPVSLAPPGWMNWVALSDLDGDGEAEMLVLQWNTLEVRGRRHGPVGRLPLDATQEPTTDEAVARLRAARDLIGSDALDAARDLLAETASRFAGRPEAVEAERLRVDAAVRQARQDLLAAGKAITEGETDGVARHEAALAAFRAAATEARASADRHATDPTLRRRFLVQTAEAAREGLDFAAAADALGAALAETGGTDDDRTLVRDRDGFGWLGAVTAATTTAVDLAEPGLPMIATDPTRVRWSPAGVFEAWIDSHHRRGLSGVPVSWDGRGVRLTCDLDLQGSAWSTGCFVGLLARDGPWFGTAVRLWCHGTTAWDKQSAGLLVERPPQQTIGCAPGAWRGRWQVAWGWYPEADLVVLEVRDRDDGRVLARQRGVAGDRPRAGSYVLGVGYDNVDGDCFLAHGLHPPRMQVRVSNLRVFTSPGGVAVDRAEPRTVGGLLDQAGGQLLRGDAATAAETYRRVLSRDPSQARARIYRALALSRLGRTDDAVAELGAGLGADAYALAVALDDACRVAAPETCLAFGGLLRRMEARPPAGPAAAALHRGFCRAFHGDYADAAEALTAVAAAGLDGPALRYLRRRGQWGPAEEQNADWEWLTTHGTLPPGTEPPVVVWAPGPDDDLDSLRAAMRAASRRAAGGRWHDILALWVAASRLLLVAPDDPETLLARGQVGIATRRHGLTELDWRRRAEVLAGDAEASLRVAHLYAVRHATRETLAALEEAAARGADLGNLDRELADRLEFLAENPRWKELRETGRR